MNITLVTANKGKLQEWKRLMPPEFNLLAVDLDLEEIQSLDLEAIVKDKVMRAYKYLGRPVLVEDVSAGLTHLGGLPGPFIKFFEISMGDDALYQLADEGKDKAVVTCLIAYYDGTNLLISIGKTYGRVVASRGTHGFGFDKCFMPEGSDKTYGQMSPSEKDAISHRAKAVASMADQLKAV